MYVSHKHRPCYTSVTICDRMTLRVREDICYIDTTTHQGALVLGKLSCSSIPLLHICSRWHCKIWRIWCWTFLLRTGYRSLLFIFFLTFYICIKNIKITWCIHRNRIKPPLGNISSIWLKTWKFTFWSYQVHSVSPQKWLIPPEWIIYQFYSLANVTPNIPSLYSPRPDLTLSLSLSNTHTHSLSLSLSPILKRLKIMENGNERFFPKM